VYVRLYRRHSTQTETPFFKVQTKLQQTPIRELLQNTNRTHNRRQKRTRHQKHKRTFHRQKDQSTINRFVTDPKWNIKTVTNQAKPCFLTNQTLTAAHLRTKSSTTPYAANTAKTPQMVGYNHISTMGTVLSHEYVMVGFSSITIAVSRWSGRKGCYIKLININFRVAFEIW
jgi:hypothetical protein